jgi:hypothetical protein
MDFEGYLYHCENLHARGVDGLRENRAYLGLYSGCYARWMGDWWAEFGDRLKVVYFDDLSHHAAATVKDVCAWLEIEAGVVDRFDLAVENKTEQVRSRTAQQVALAVNRRTERFFRQHPTTKRRLRRLYYLANRSPEEMTMRPATAARLADFYQPHDVELGQQLEAMGVPRPPWWADDAGAHPRALFDQR